MMNKKTFPELSLYLLLGVIFLFSPVVLAVPVPSSPDPDILFVRIPAAAKPPTPFISSQRPVARLVDGCQIVRLSSSGSGKNIVPLTPEFLSACDPAVSFQGQKILFAGKRKQGESWQIWQMDANGENKVQVTYGTMNSVSPLYVGSLFHLDDKAPTRKIAYVGDNHLYTCDLDGKNPQRITYNLYPEFSPDVLPNGRIIFSSARQKEFETGSGNILDLLAVNIDGTDLMGYLTGLEVPGNKEMVRTGWDGCVYFIRSNVNRWLGGGTLSYVSTRRPTRAYTLAGDSEKGFYHSPCPLPDGGLAVSYRSKDKGALYGLFTLNPRTGNRKKALYISPDHHCIDACVLAPHPVVKGRSSFENPAQETGVFYCISVYVSDRPEVNRLSKGSVEGVRVLEGVRLEREKTVVRRVLGTAPVEPDGSFHIRVPAKTPLAFQLLNKDGKVVSSQITWTWVMPRESRGCVGCHEGREMAPPNQFARALVKPAVVLDRKRSQEQQQKKGNR